MSTLSKNVIQTTQDFDHIKSAIIEKGVDIPDKTPTSEYADKIRQISGGTPPSGTLNITQNGTYDVADYAEAHVDVPTIGVNLDDFIAGRLTAVSTALEIIPDFAFSGKTKLQSVDAPNATYIGKYAFSASPAQSMSGSGSSSDSEGDGEEDSDDLMVFNNDSLVTVHMPNVTQIDVAAFSNDANLVVTELPESLIVIQSNAFKNCPKVTLASLPSGLMFIGDYALDPQPNLDLSNMPPMLDFIGGGIDIPSWREYISQFYDSNDKIDFAQLPAFWTDVNFGGFFPQRFRPSELPEMIHIKAGQHNRVAQGLFADYSTSSGSTLREITMDNTILKIETQAFEHCQALQNVQLSTSLLQIEQSAFANSTLMYINLDDTSLQHIGEFAFSGCTQLEEIGAFPDGLQYIGEYAFQDSALSEVYLPDSLTYLGHHAFYGCGSLTTLQLPSGLSEIADGTFRGCNSLQSAIIPSGIHHIGADAFQHCSSLNSLQFDSDSQLLSIGSYAFFNTGFTHLQLPASIDYIDTMAFGNSSLTYLDLTQLGQRILSLPGSAESVFGTRLQEIIFSDQAAMDAYAASPNWSGLQNIFVLANS